jgi:hypothetical protein
METMQVWHLLDPVIAHLPCGDGEVEKRDGAVNEDKKRKYKPSSKEGESGGEGKTGIRCLMCKEVHKPLCKLPDDFRKKQRDKRKLKRAEKARNTRAEQKPNQAK